MDKLGFVEGIKILSSCYQKVISNDDMLIWYEMLKDIESEAFKKTIIELCKERAYMPTIHDILDKTKTVKNNYYLSILEQMKKDGYFKLGVVPLSPEQEEAITKYCDAIFSSGADTEEFFYRLGLKDGLKLRKVIKQTLKNIAR